MQFLYPSWRLKVKYYGFELREHFTHPAYRIPHTPSHSTVGSAPKHDTDYRHLHTSAQSGAKESRVFERNAPCL